MPCTRRVPGDLGAPPALNRFIDANNDGRIISDTGTQQEQQQEMAEGTAGPGGAVEDPVLGLDVALVAQPHDAQGSGDGALAGREDRADEQDLGVLPGRGTEAAAEGRHNLYNRPWQVQQCLSFL